MSYPYPQDRTRDKQEKGAQPYQDDREAMARGAAQAQTEAERFGEEHLAPDAPAAGDMEQALTKSLRETNDEIMDEHSGNRERS